MSLANFKACCDEYLESFMHINLDEKITSELFDLIAMQSNTRGLIFSNINLVSWLPEESKILIKYNSNNIEENDEEEKESIDIDLTDQNNLSWNYENAIAFRWSNV